MVIIQAIAFNQLRKYSIMHVHGFTGSMYIYPLDALLVMYLCMQYKCYNEYGCIPYRKLIKLSNRTHN